MRSIARAPISSTGCRYVVKPRYGLASGPTPSYPEREGVSVEPAALQSLENGQHCCIGWAHKRGDGGVCKHRCQRFVHMAIVWQRNFHNVDALTAEVAAHRFPADVLGKRVGPVDDADRDALVPGTEDDLGQGVPSVDVIAVDAWHVRSQFHAAGHDHRDSLEHREDLFGVQLRGGEYHTIYLK